MQVEGDSLLIGRHIHHSAFSLVDRSFSQSDEEEVWEVEYTTCGALPELEAEIVHRRRRRRSGSLVLMSLRQQVVREERQRGVAVQVAYVKTQTSKTRISHFRQAQGAGSRVGTRRFQAMGQLDLTGTAPHLGEDLHKVRFHHAPRRSGTSRPI
jgi:hypothetical protein